MNAIRYVHAGPHTDRSYFIAFNGPKELALEVVIDADDEDAAVDKATAIFIMMRGKQALAQMHVISVREATPEEATVEVAL